jgi:hypothetical protein
MSPLKLLKIVEVSCLQKEKNDSKIFFNKTKNTLKNLEKKKKEKRVIRKLPTGRLGNSGCRVNPFS